MDWNQYFSSSQLGATEQRAGQGRLTALPPDTAGMAAGSELTWKETSGQ